MWRFLPGVSKISASKKIPLHDNSASTTVRESHDVDVRQGGRSGVGGWEGGRGEGDVNVFRVCVELGDWASEKLYGRVQLEGHSPKWRALQNFSFQPWIIFSS